MKQSHPGEANSRSTSQGTSPLYNMEPEGSLPCSQEPAMDPQPLSQMNLIYISSYPV
jgi:hypothetical protein